MLAVPADRAMFRRLALARPADGWPSGLRRTLGKRVYGKPYRGFESRPIRHYRAVQSLGRVSRAFAPRIASMRPSMAFPSTKIRASRVHLRIRVPGDLRPCFGKAEIHRSLGTGRQKARSIARTLRLRVEECFGNLRRQRAAGASNDVLAFEARRFCEAGLPRCVRSRSGGAVHRLATARAPLQKSLPHSWPTGRGAGPGRRARCRLRPSLPSCASLATSRLPH